MVHIYNNFHMALLNATQNRKIKTHHIATMLLLYSLHENYLKTLHIFPRSTNIHH